MNRIGIQLWTRCRDVAAALIAGCWPGRAFGDVQRWIEDSSPGTQNTIVFGTLAALFASSLVAAQFGLIGLCLFWLAVIWIIR